jgi:hypothetical protein
MTLGRYALMALAIAAGTQALAWPLLAPSGRTAALAGAGLAVANTVTAYALVRWSSRRSTTAFMGAVLGGMLGRMGVMLGAVLAGVLLLGMPEVPLALSLLVYFTVFLVFELRILHRTRPEPAVR